MGRRQKRRNLRVLRVLVAGLLLLGPTSCDNPGEDSEPCKLTKKERREGKGCV